MRTYNMTCDCCGTVSHYALDTAEVIALLRRNRTHRRCGGTFQPRRASFAMHAPVLSPF